MSSMDLPAADPADEPEEAVEVAAPEDELEEDDDELAQALRPTATTVSAARPVTRVVNLRDIRPPGGW
jgi:hypothetical protein